MAEILIVDDDDGVRSVLRRALERYGHLVEEASDGKQAFHKFEEKTYDLVIADMFMPVRDGLEVITHLRKTLPDVKVIAISGRNPLYLDSAVELGAVRSLRKPFQLTDLVREVDAALNQTNDGAPGPADTA